MTIRVDAHPLHEVEVSVGASATAELYVHLPTPVTVRSQSVLRDFYVVTESVTGQLDMVGEFDLACGDQFRDASAATLAGDAAEAVVDFTRLRFIDAHGIETLIEFRNALAARGATLRIINADARIGRVFAICGLGAMLTGGAAPSRAQQQGIRRHHDDLRTDAGAQPPATPPRTEITSSAMAAKTGVE